MLYNRAGKLKVIHIAKRECGLDDDEYRLLLKSSANVDSAAKIQTQAQFDSVMAAFKKLGFHHNRPYQTKTRKHENRWGCSDAQRAYIEGLWLLMSRTKNLGSLEAMARRIAKIDHPRFLDRKGATQIILALRQMCLDEGINPDKKESLDDDK